MKLPDAISRYIGSWLWGQGALAYVLLGHDTRVLQWGGALSQLGIKPLKKGKPIADQMFFMEGLLPLHQPAVYMAMIQPDSHHCLDLHLFRTDAGYGLILMDAAEAGSRLTAWQQKANATALQNEKQLPTCARGRFSERDASLERFTDALGYAALVLGPEGALSLLGDPPPWLPKLCPQAIAQPCTLSSRNTMSFLDNFLNDAHGFWAKESFGYIKSGLWIETDPAGDEHLLEATALNTGKHKYLLISRDTCMIDEKQALIQKGRSLSLSNGRGKRMQAELEARVRRHTVELEEANARLAHELAKRKELEKERAQMSLHLQQAQKMEAIGTLAGGIAHDFNNILAAVIGFSELSLAKIAKDSKLHTNIQQVLSAGWRAKGLINQILTFSRQSEPEVQPVQLGMLAIEALKLLRASLPAAVEIRQEINSNGIVMADPTQLHQVIMNLCANAGQAMGASGGELLLRLNNCDIGSEGTRGHPDLPPGPYLELVVRDSGPGMSEDVLARIFEPFFTTKAKGEGTGMGLSVVHGIVKSCGGVIDVQSQVRVGSTFCVLLPAASQTEARQSASSKNFPTGHERILFVDDEAAIMEFASEALGMLGYQVHAENDGARALALFSEAPFNFDLVITDMNMPNMSGKQLAVALLNVRPDIPILLCSGYSETMNEAHASDMGIRGYMMKPVALKELARRVRTLLDEKG